MSKTSFSINGIKFESFLDLLVNPGAKNTKSYFMSELSSASKSSSVVTIATWASNAS